MSQHHSVLIVGGGAAGVSVANNMRRQNASLDIAVIEPSEVHYYQPGFTIIGGGAYTLKQTTRQEADLIHPSVKWIKDYVDSFQPEANSLTLRSGDMVTYDYLVVCPGLQLDWHKIAGLSETLGQNQVCSNYLPKTAEYTWACISQIKEGTAIFTQPPMPIKCAGAPQKIMYLAADRFRKQGILDQFNIEFCNAGPAIFGVPFFAKALMKVVQGYGIKTHFNHNLVAIDGRTGSGQQAHRIEEAQALLARQALDLLRQPTWDAPLLEELSQVMADASICGLGQAAPNPVLGVLRHFGHEVGAAASGSSP
jgi:sulfide:quinone oxidoreductase